MRTASLLFSMVLTDLTVINLPFCSSARLAAFLSVTEPVLEEATKVMITSLPTVSTA